MPATSATDPAPDTDPAPATERDRTTGLVADLVAGLRGGRVVNVHSRVIGAPAAVIGAELDRLAGPQDRLWPSPAWWPIKLGDAAGARGDEPPVVGSTGGHGPIRYTVTEYEPGRRVRLRFAPEVGIDGFHELTVEPLEGAGGPACRVTHVIRARLATPLMRLEWPLLVRHLHDALLEDLLDRAELLGTGRVQRAARWSPLVRAVHALLWPRPEPVAIPASAQLIRSAFPRTDLADAYAVRLRSGLPERPQPWADEVFGRRPGGAGVLMAVRNAVAPVLGIERSSARVLDPWPGSTADEVLLGADAAHLDVRVSFVVDDGRIVVSTVARTHNRRGRVYLAVIRRVHPMIVRRMLRQTSRRLALAARGEVAAPPS